MTDQPPPSPAMAALRKRAEDRISRVLDKSVELDAGESRGLIHELHVHQIELEMQNEQLRQVQATLEVSRAQYHDLYEEAPVAYLIAGASGALVGCNQMGSTLLRIAPESVSRRRIVDFIAPAFIPEFSEQRDTLLASGIAESFDAIMRRADGSTFWATLHISLAPVDTSGSMVLRIAIVDISDRKRMEEAAAQLAAIVASSDLAIFSVDLAGMITSWNGGAERLFGFSETRIVGQSSSVLLPPSRKGEDVLNSSRVARGEQVACETVRLRRDGTPLPVYLTASPILNAAGAIVGMSQIMRDISEQVGSRENLSLLLEELRRREMVMQEADRRKDEFIATLAHELRNPLAPIRNAAEVLRQSANLDERGQWCRGVIDRQVAQMAALLEDLLDVSRITRDNFPIHRDVIDLRRAIEQAVETTQPLMQSRGHQLLLELPDQPLLVEGDLARLTQVFGNLLNNAAKYTDRGGQVSLTAIARDGEIEIRVKDTGIGIDNAFLPRIFELFSQLGSALDRSQGGLGIGLYLVKNLVELHRGSVSVSSAGDRQGSEFVVHLPALNVNEAQGRPDRRDNELPRGRQSAPRRVLIADDNQDEATTMAMLLRMNKFEVAVAHDGEEAFELATAVLPDIMVLDMGMPRLNGYELTERVRQTPWGKSVFIVAYTGWGRPEDRRRSKEVGVDVHLSKPVAPSRLLELLASQPTRRHE